MRFNNAQIKIDKDVIADILMIALTLFVVSINYKSQINNAKSLEEKRDAEIKKNLVLDDIGKSEGALNAYNEGMSKKDVSEVINIINNIALVSGIEINSLRPLREEDYPVYIKYPFEIRFNTHNYHLIGKFISNLENHPVLFFINLLNVQQSSGFGMPDRQDSSKVELTLNIFVYKK
jgi:Tfp pilus assembly protein PilO